MTKQIYLNRLEKGIKIIRTYDIMINGQGNYKSLPHYMKVFGDFCLDYLRYKAIEVVPDLNNVESISTLVEACKENDIEVVPVLVEHMDLVQNSKDAQYTDVSECIKLMPTTNVIIEQITKELAPVMP